MTPEELNRTMEFILASQARMAAAQEQDRLDRLEFEKWARGMDSRLADLQRQQADLLVHQSERLDSFQKLHDDWRQRDESFQTQTLRLLNMILDRLQPFNKPA